MSIKSVAALSAALLMALTLVACNRPSPSVSCSGSGGSSGGLRQINCKIVFKAASDQSIDLATFDASHVLVDMSASLSDPMPGTYAGTALLYSGNTLVAARSFEVQVIGFTGYIKYPAAFTTWVRSYAGQADGYQLAADTRFTEHLGANSATFELRYMNQPVTGVSQAWYISPNGGCAGSCQAN